PARVDHEAGTQASGVPAFADAHGGPGRVEMDLLDEGGLEQGDPGLSGGVLEEDLVELRARHFVAVGRPGLALAKVEAVPEIGLLVVEGRPVLDEEAVTLHALAHAQPIEHRHHGGQQWLAHVEAGEYPTLPPGDAK